MSAQELTVYIPDSGEWRQQTGNICFIDGGDSCPDVSAPARRLSANDRFEVTEIPAAMTKMGWHTSAALLNKWFHCAPKNQAMSSFEKTYGRALLVKKLGKFKDKEYIDSLAETGGNMHDLHTKFQFQRFR